MSDDDDAWRRLAALPGFGAEKAETARLTRLPGLTNRVYAVQTGGERLCLRIPGPGTDAIIDRRAEERNARAAAAVGVAPDVLYFGTDGTMLTRFVEGETLTRERLRGSAGALGRVAVALRRLHNQAGDFVGTFRTFDTIDRYVALLDRHGVRPSGARRDILRGGDAVRAALAAHPPKLRPCHCDPTGGNLIDTGERVWLVDWEYAAMNDPMWDLAYFSAESRFGRDEDAALLSAYFDRRPREPESARLELTKAACDLLGATWALVQGAHGNRATDFEAYAERLFARAAERMAAADFSRQLEATRQT